MLAEADMVMQQITSSWEAA